ncbi:hypothetical protein K8T06_15875 [bacterium]|nr:hypothetical protein [bacterium]
MIQKNRLYVGFFLILLLVSLFGTGSAKKISKTPENIKMVWFDSDGLYHFGDILEYLNAVNCGKIKDKEIKTALSSVVKKGKKVTINDVKKVSETLDPLKQTAAIYYPDSGILEKKRADIIRLFGKSLETTGKLTVKFYGIQPQGQIGLIPGSTTTITMIAIPEDPVIMSTATTKFLDTHIPVLEKNLMDAANMKEWVPFAIKLVPSSTGTMNLVNLHQGPWIIYQNLYNILACCYRVQIEADHEKVLIADKLLWKPGFRARKKR